MIKRVTPRYLENAALYYLGRFASSAENLRRVLMRKVERSVAEHGTDRAEAAAWVEALIARQQAAGLLDDQTYAAMKARSLSRRGGSGRAIRARLAQKGVAPDLVESAMTDIDDEAEGKAELRAAVALARRRRLGAFRPASARAEFRNKDLAALARAGFGGDTARRVIDADDPDTLFDA